MLLHSHIKAATGAMISEELSRYIRARSQRKQWNMESSHLPSAGIAYRINKGSHPRPSVPTRTPQILPRRSNRFAAAGILEFWVPCA